MPRPIVTEELVFGAAETLFTAGQTPSIITVRQHIGGGSYSTIKHHLDAWFVKRKIQQNQLPVPDPLAAKGVEFVHLLWGVALDHRDGHMAHLREESQRQIAEVKNALSMAEQTIAHLEMDIDQLHQELAESRSALDVAQERLTHIQADKCAAEARADTLERQIDALHKDISLTHQDRESAVGDTLAEIQRQLARQTEIIAQLSQSET
jgi:Plasmid replication region DNA-binding N-term